MQVNLGRELDLAVDVRRRCKNSSVLSCIEKRTKDCDHVNEVATVHSLRARASSSEEIEGIWKKRFVRKISSPASVAGVP